jgi:uncharacterized membrane protein YsdA (DUF1294 family)/cold shock CspA family protein
LAPWLTEEGTMREQGVLAEWNDDRGFGFISPANGGPRVFVHISKFPHGRRPVATDLVTYDVALDQRNRRNASHVAYLSSDRSRSKASRAGRMALATATSFYAILIALVMLDRAPVLLVPAYGFLSLIAFAMYRGDKAAAEQGAWRTPESSLHLIALWGGWPGALVARQVFRHKTIKQPFRTIFWLTVIANCGVLAWLVYELPAWMP